MTSEAHQKKAPFRFFDQSNKAGEPKAAQALQIDIR
jgi:hypothetical protein